MRNLSTKRILLVLIILLLLLDIKYANAQRYLCRPASGQVHRITLPWLYSCKPGQCRRWKPPDVFHDRCIGWPCSKNLPGTDLAAKPAGGTPVSVKLGSGDKLLSLTALGGITLQAYIMVIHLLGNLLLPIPCYRR